MSIPDDNDHADIDLAKAIGLRQAQQILRGRSGRPPCLDTVRRWVTQGSSVRGQKVILRSVLLGGERLTTPEWVEEFQRARLRGGRKFVIEPSRTPARREKAARAAMKRMGLGLG